MKTRYISILIIIITVISIVVLNNNINLNDVNKTNNDYLNATTLKESNIYTKTNYGKKVIKTIKKDKKILVLKEEYSDEFGNNYYKVISKKYRGYIKSNNIIISDIGKYKQVIEGESIIENNIKNIAGK